MSDTIGALSPTEVPALSENADIQEAFRLYHYGAPSGVGIGEYDTTNTNPLNLVVPSIAYTLYNLQQQITTISGTLGILTSAYTAKGGILTATAPSTVVMLPVGSNGKILTANSGTATGLEWATPEITPTNTVTMSNKSFLSPQTDVLIFEGATPDANETTLGVVDPTADRTALLPDRSGTVQMDTIETNPQTGNYTLVLADKSKLVEVNSGTAKNVTIPLNATVAYPVGTQIMIGQTGAGQVSIIVTGGVTLNGTPQGTTNVIKLRDQWSVVVLIKRDTDTWLAVGDITT
jgi:hypothetical protein